MSSLLIAFWILESALGTWFQLQITTHKHSDGRGFFLPLANKIKKQVLAEDMTQKIQRAIQTCHMAALCTVLNQTEHYGHE